jgi:hypothetical protein
MDNRPGRQPIRPKDHLSSLIREALAARVSHAQPSPYGRQVLLVRAHEAQSKKAKRRFLLYPLIRPPYGRPLASFFLGYNGAISMSSERDPYLLVNLNSIFNPMVGMLR